MSSNVHDASHSSAPSHSWLIASNVSSFFKTLAKSKTSSPFGVSCAEQAPSYTLPLPPQATRLHDRSADFDDFFLSGMLEGHRPRRPASQFSSDPPPYTPYPSAIVDSDTDVVKEPPTIARMVFFCGFG
ncbi:MAG TPA: hypothetical protein VGO47_12260 [Chlamydiales bacterium]|nr:hypothetical protein [Chlamydiales bacterium]